jgi:hypothetical protein
MNTNFFQKAQLILWNAIVDLLSTNRTVRSIVRYTGKLINESNEAPANKKMAALIGSISLMGFLSGAFVYLLVYGF